MFVQLPTLYFCYWPFWFHFPLCVYVHTHTHTHRRDTHLTVYSHLRSDFIGHPWEYYTIQTSHTLTNTPTHRLLVSPTCSEWGTYPHILFRQLLIWLDCRVKASRAAVSLFNLFWKEKTAAINFGYRYKQSERGQVDLWSSFIRSAYEKKEQSSWILVKN